MSLAVPGFEPIYLHTRGGPFTKLRSSQLTSFAESLAEPLDGFDRSSVQKLSSREKNLAEQALNPGLLVGSKNATSVLCNRPIYLLWTPDCSLFVFRPRSWSCLLLLGRRVLQTSRHRSRFLRLQSDPEVLEKSSIQIVLKSLGNVYKVSRLLELLTEGIKPKNSPIDCSSFELSLSWPFYKLRLRYFSCLATSNAPLLARWHLSLAACFESFSNLLVQLPIASLAVD